MNRCSTLARGFVISTRDRLAGVESAHAGLTVDEESAARHSTHAGLCESPRFSAGYVLDPVWGDAGGRSNHDTVIVDYNERPAVTCKELGEPIGPGAVGVDKPLKVPRVV